MSFGQLSFNGRALQRFRVVTEGMGSVDILSLPVQADVREFGAVGDGVADDAPAIIAALAASDAVFIAPGMNCLIGRRLTLQSGKALYGIGDAKLTLADGVDDAMIVIASGASHVTIRELELDGNKSNNTGGPGIASTGDGATYVTIENCTIHDCSADGIRFSGSVGLAFVIVHGCFVYANVTAGITSDDTITDFSWVENVVYNNGTHGIGLIGIGKHGVIAGNVARDNSTDGGPEADQITGYNQGIDGVSVVGNSTRGGNNHGIHFGGSNIVVADNLVDSPAVHGIVVESNPAGCSNVVVEGNIVDAPGAAGIYAEFTDGLNVSDNAVNAAATHGIWIADTVTQCSVSGNIVRGCTNSGARADSSNGVVFASNMLQGNGSGVTVSLSDDCVVDGNICKGNTGGHGVLLSNALRCIVSDNHLRSNKYAIEELGTTDYSVICGNNLSGNTTSNTIDLVGAHSTVGPNGGYDPNPVALTLASNACAIPGFRREPVLMVSLAGEGGANDQLDTLSGGIPGQLVTLTAADGAVDIIVSGVNNIYVAGGVSFTLSSVADTITLMYSAALTAWIEVTRSNNA